MRRTGRIAVRVVVPAVTVAAVMRFGFGTAGWSHIALVHWLTRPQYRNSFWFVEAYLVIMVAIVAALAVPWVRAAYATDAWRTAMVALAAMLVARYLVLAFYDDRNRGLPGTVAWLFVAGVAMATADNRRRRLVTTAVAIGGAFGFFAGEAGRNLAIMVGLAALAFVPALPVPRLLVNPLGALAAASLHIYLVQFQVFRFFGSPIIQFAAAIAAGLGLCAVCNGVLRRRLPPLPAVTGRRVAARQLVREDVARVVSP